MTDQQVEAANWALFEAAARGDVVTVGRLLDEEGADIEAQADGTALIAAACKVNER
jgi:hypothetical protein